MNDRVSVGSVGEKVSRRIKKMTEFWRQAVYCSDKYTSKQLVSDQWQVGMENVQKYMETTFEKQSEDSADTAFCPPDDCAGINHTLSSSSVGIYSILFTPRMLGLFKMEYNILHILT